MTRRVPATLKKRLQANLENLTPKEAGRLLVIYANEALKKKSRVADYAPVKELFSAFDARIDKARGKPEEGKAINAHDGLFFLAGLFETVNIEGPHLFMETAFAAFRVKMAILLIIQEDAISTVVKSVRGHLLNTPQPITKEDFDRIVDWVYTDRPETLAEVAESVIDTEEEELWEKTKTDRPVVQIPKDFTISYFSMNEDDWSKPGRWESYEEYKADMKDVRRAWAADQGDRLLQDVFAGNKAALDDWIDYKEFDGDAYSEADRKARFDAIFADLVAKVKAGELVGGDALVADDIFAPVLIEDGAIPAWAALRVLWRPYVTSRDYRVYDRATTDKAAPYGVDEVRHRNGSPLSAGELRDLVADFLKACRGRPWGKKLPAKPDLDALADFLTQSASHFLHITAPDLGRVDFKAWAKHDADGLTTWKIEPAATSASLSKIGIPIIWAESWVGDYFHVAQSPDLERMNTRHIIAMMDTLAVNRQPFTYRRKEDEDDGLIPLSDFLGIELLTPLESAVRSYQDVADKLASIRAALDAISDRYFDGLPVLEKGQASNLEEAEGYISEAGEALQEWLTRLAGYPWQVDTTTLDPGEPEADEETVEAIVEEWLRDTRYRTRIKDETGLIW